MFSSHCRILAWPSAAVKSSVEILNSFLNPGPHTHTHTEWNNMDTESIISSKYVYVQLHQAADMNTQKCLNYIDKTCVLVNRREKDSGAEEGQKLRAGRWDQKTCASWYQIKKNNSSWCHRPDKNIHMQHHLDHSDLWVGFQGHVEHSDVEPWFLKLVVILP